MLTNLPSALATNANDIRDIRPPVEIANWLVLALWILGGLIIAGAIIAFVVYQVARSKQVVPAPIIPPHVRAKQKLQEALALISQPKPFVIAVSDAARHYLEERFEFRAPERTTEEFLHELKRTNLLMEQQKESLGEFLQQCDLVKFAKYEPGEPEMRELHGAALRLVEETEPVEPAQNAEQASELVNPQS